MRARNLYNAKFRDTIRDDESMGTVVRVCEHEDRQNMLRQIKEAVRTGKPCNPRVDIDAMGTEPVRCDGRRCLSAMMPIPELSRPTSFLRDDRDAIIPRTGKAAVALQGDLKQPDRTKSIL